MEMQIKVWQTNLEAPGESFSTTETTNNRHLDMESQGWVCLKELTVDFTPLTAEQRVPLAVQKLEEQITQLQAVAGMKVTELRGKIQNLLSITNDSGRSE